MPSRHRVGPPRSEKPPFRRADGFPDTSRSSYTALRWRRPDSLWNSPYFRFPKLGNPPEKILSMTLPLTTYAVRAAFFPFLGSDTGSSSRPLALPLH